ncbi:X-Pro dipeptidyl-peptidase [Sphingobacterium mizutaii NBRC 14946 = DSM 11724]|uniref:Prolyl tripeptidyl peptidase n=2 Tax=Sphingobacterium mizutaii TaxID=1010 RepID=A0AAJ5C0F4_9SPHI|nr:DPP IV N-terminal domain-containing protein [Sphingobacterium mizutaii]GEM68434.1 X-Pro dipeptidyl-peptidase [Sphingobacterium mizutaii NBRC 14946 = DSM 11724]SDL06036.1 Dipeptidyl aminopeptidase/acylaminoacyl peptidase [Sphingobacterium mizutaii]SNV50882.1 Prolyl tripeptidyl peptidase precursor [Sphingobacterium mizutaii]
MKHFLTFVLLLSFAISQGQEKSTLTKPNYQLASKFSPSKLSKLIFSTEVNPNWINFGDKFWYEYNSPSGKKWYLVDPKTKKKSELFDHADMASRITSIVKNPFDAQHLEIRNLRFMDNENLIRFEVQSSKDTVKTKEEIQKLTNKKDTIKKKLYYFEYNISNNNLRELGEDSKEKTKLFWANFNPDTSRVYYAKNYNLYWMDYSNYLKAQKDEKDSTIVEHQITSDGVQYYAWGGDEYSVTTGDKKSEDEEKKKRKPVWINWSPNGQYFTLTKKDNREYSALWVINNVAAKRPTLETYKYLMPGETDSTEVELYIFDANTLKPKQINVSAFKNQTISNWSQDRTKESYKGKHYINYWLGNNEEFYIARSSRDLKRIDIVAVNVNGNSRTVLEERSNVYQDIKKPYFVNNGSQFIHWSQRDGWGHFYLYDKNGRMINQITKGEFHCDDLTRYNEATGTLYFKANGKEKNIDPYYTYYYSVNKSGGAIKLLTPGDFDHQVVSSESSNYFIDNYSRVNTAPISNLYNANGQLVMKLEETDLSNLFAAGYKFPEPFKVKAGDGITDLYGVMYKPFDFDSTKTYPIIEYVYPGPQTEAVNKSFGRSMDRIDRLAQMGFIVISVGNRGGHPSRSKWYHTYGYGNLRDYGLEDKKVAAEQLADKYPFIDISKVGITGHSGGGFMSTAAMLVYPDFFKVAVSGAGNHENNIYNRWWSERHHGVKEEISAKGDTTFSYTISRNTELAKNLKGKLLIATGDIDNNVHPANSIRMVDALIRANKRFDFLLLPGQRHGFGDMTEYFFWRMADYFSQHLLGASEMNEVDMMEMNREKPLK